MSFFRIDRLATLYLFEPLQGIRPRLRRRIPILMYHGISEDVEPGSHPYYRVATSPRLFTQHMQYLHDHEYSVIDLMEAASSPGTEPRWKNPVVLTFDDGYRNFFTHAFPVMQRYGFSATVFLSTRYVGNPAQLLKGNECLTWTEVRDLHGRGIQFGSHTVSHPQLWGLPPREIERELRESKRALEDNLGAEVRSFAYPYAFPEQDGRFVQALRGTLESCGYQIGVSTILGSARPSDDRFFLPRLPVNSSDDPALFRAKLAGAYDWLHVPQYLRKLGKLRPAATLSLESSSA
jgi:peptidoglycan/xylan/chitin deacetylase (PgdA/CDA1 family)